MAASSRFLWMGLGFLGLIGLFLFVQRQPSNVVPASADVEQETSPQVEVFEAQLSPPQLIKPSGSGASLPDTTTSSNPAGAQQGSAVAADAGYALDAAPSATLNTPGVSGAVTGTGPAVGAPESTGPQSGPAASVDPSAPITEMISLPPSGPGPEDGSFDLGGIAPEQGSIDSAMAPEAGSLGVMGDGPELMPVTHPGPSGEMPDNNGPLPPQ